MTLYSSTTSTDDSPSEIANATPGAGVMSLRLKINLVFSALTFLLFAILILVEVLATRNSVAEEMEASGRIATQLLSRVSSFYAHND